MAHLQYNQRHEQRQNQAMTGGDLLKRYGPKQMSIGWKGQLYPEAPTLAEYEAATRPGIFPSAGDLHIPNPQKSAVHPGDRIASAIQALHCQTTSALTETNAIIASTNALQHR